ncbi:unnamed protein product [Adineta ricciae]|uniref:C2H2-type domain-containing protein n=1 Tax=Adineta ricciae TaxID=249248 RepID=A0A815BGU3_ADIRI|nr:unnamed protein product [Adineta ricciae]
MPINEQIRTIIIKKPCFTVSPSSPHQVDKKQQTYSCSHCSKSFSSPSHLSRHILTHTGEKPCLCSECGQQFSQISSLERHQRTKHNKPNLNNSLTDHLYQCTLCHEYFSLKHNLKMHEKKLHQIQTNFFCNLCSAYFTCKSSLQKHRNFRHRSAVKTQQLTNMSDNWTTMQDDQHNSTVNVFDSSATFPITSNDLCNSNMTNQPSYESQQSVHYQILKCNEYN